MGAYIELVDLCKSYKTIPVVDHISLSFEKGKCYGIVGRNGSGKSVLLKLIAGYAVPDSGKVIIQGKQEKKDIDFIQNAGVVINSPQFISSMSGIDNLKFLADIRGLITEDTIWETLKLLELADSAKKKVKTYSEGMRQRLRIAQAIMENPEILLLDEPMNSLDQQGVLLVRKLLKEYVSRGNTILFTSHLKEDMEELADEVYEIDAGHISQPAAVK